MKVQVNRSGALVEIPFCELKKGDVVVDGAHTFECASDAHYSGDASYDGYIVYDTAGESHFSDDTYVADYPAAVFMQYPPDGSLTLADFRRIESRLCSNNGSEDDEFLPVISETDGCNIFGIIRSVDADELADSKSADEFIDFVCSTAVTACQDVTVMFNGMKVEVLIQRQTCCSCC